MQHPACVPVYTEYMHVGNLYVVLYDLDLATVILTGSCSYLSILPIQVSADRVGHSNGCLCHFVVVYLYHSLSRLLLPVADNTIFKGSVV